MIVTATIFLLFFVIDKMYIIMDEFYIAALENLELQENAANYRKVSHSERFYASFIARDYIFINNFRLTKDLVRYVINILTLI